MPLEIMPINMASWRLPKVVKVEILAPAKVIVQVLLVKQIALEAVKECLVSQLVLEAVQVVVKGLVLVVAPAIAPERVLMDVKHIALESVRLIVNMIKPILLMMEEIVLEGLFSLGQIQMNMVKL